MSSSYLKSMQIKHVTTSVAEWHVETIRSKWHWTHCCFLNYILDLLVRSCTFKKENWNKFTQIITRNEQNLPHWQSLCYSLCSCQNIKKLSPTLNLWSILWQGYFPVHFCLITLHISVPCAHVKVILQVILNHWCCVINWKKKTGKSNA